MHNAAPATELPLRVQDEVACRHCDVHCEKVVYPGSCIRMACPFVYAYEAWGHTYMGCLQKVFDVEIDLELLRSAESTRSGFGAVRARRPPLPMCDVEVVETYTSREDEIGCRNPEFHELPRERANFRVFAVVAD
ncbi:MAG: hypothetical protein OEW52_04445 [Thermoleophilia bacterium]|nr:hypothetical protein [Thermoleophilia bacterium]MDH4340203.1 hypothetical protein [Thermoleophilia bacterium]MDH5280384.1 hypothetical protein [Thermoleophilia bacterium]